MHVYVLCSCIMVCVWRSELGSVLPLCGVWVLNSGFQAYPQVPLLAEPSFGFEVWIPDAAHKMCPKACPLSMLCGAGELSWVTPMASSLLPNPSDPGAPSPRAHSFPPLAQRMLLESLPLPWLPGYPPKHSSRVDNTSVILKGLDYEYTDNRKPP